MKIKFENYLESLKSQNRLSILSSFQCGLERESLRLDTQGYLSQKKHPPVLGSPLTHPYIKTDFAEAQIEWITPPFNQFKKVMSFLNDLMLFTAKSLSQDMFWPYSMPCPLPDKKQIQIARFGSSHLGQLKEIYRYGLSYRYGIELQLISSLHFNFSFAPPFWQSLHAYHQSLLSLTDFRTTSYLNMIRNILREGWILSYLFGASPVLDPSYLRTRIKGLVKLNDKTLGYLHATSLRMSSLGYYSRIQNQLPLSFNTLSSYIKDMEYVLSTPHRKYADIGCFKKNQRIQLNDHCLQTESEQYGRVRPKTPLRKGQTLLQGLKANGIGYLEIRSLDINPFLPLGIAQEHLLFLHQFLIYCLAKPSPPLSKQDQKELVSNQNRVAIEGRNPKLLLDQGSKRLLLSEWGKEILSHMQPLAAYLDQSQKNSLYDPNLKVQQDKMKRPDLTPSGQIINHLIQSGESLEDFGLHLAQKHHTYFIKRPLCRQKQNHFQHTAQKSLEAKQTLETESQVLLHGYETLELSTQILIREAKRHHIEVDVLDPHSNVLKLTQGEHIEYVKQATKTSKDTCMTIELLNNKGLTQKLLSEQGLSVPEGASYTSFETACQDYFLYKKNRIVIKPQLTNYGQGLSFIAPHEEKKYQTALQEAFRLCHLVLVEPFCQGHEHRFLIIDDRVEGIVKRLPAHVIGDGVHTIKELVYLKNHDSSFYRPPKQHLRLTQIEKHVLHSQNLSIDHIPKKNQHIPLRYNSNVSTGGDAIDVTGKIHPSYQRLAIQATRILKAKICGVDMLIPSPHQAAPIKGYTIIELNDNPMLSLHAFPYRGKKRNVAYPLLKLLGFSLSTKTD